MMKVVTAMLAMSFLLCVAICFHSLNASPLVDEVLQSGRMKKHSRSRLRVLFGFKGQRASQLLRNQMIASYMSQFFSDRVAVTLWKIEDIVKHKAVSHTPPCFDVCVGTKAYDSRFRKWCKSHGALYVHDMIDNKEMLGPNVRQIMDEARTKGVREKFPYNIDTLLVSTHFHQNLLEKYFTQHAVVVPHQHTNIMSRHSSPERFRNLRGGALRLPDGKKKSFHGTLGFVSAEENELNEDELGRLKKIVCCKHGMRLRIIKQDGSGKVHFVHTEVKDYVCDSVKPAYSSFESGMKRKDLISKWGKIMSPEDLWETQEPFHRNSTLDDIDLALVWPPRGDYDMLHLAARPVTRLVHWWSHGVPTIYFPYMSYTETADAYGYYNCDELGLLPLRYATSMKVVDTLISVLLKNPSLRDCLSARGRQIAELFSPKIIASRFVRVLEEAARRKPNDSSLY